MITSRIRTVAVLLAVAVVPVTAAACGSGGGSATSAASSTTTEAPTTTAAPTTTTTVDPGTLPQTDQKPTASGAGFDARMNALANAIIANDPSGAMPSFFPVTAYKQVKALPDPASDWQTRLVGAFKTDIAKANAQLGRNAASAKFLGVRVPDTATWVKPGEEYNVGPYWRVYKSQMDFAVDGRTVSIPIESMISWRGQWYVVHLGAFR